MYNRGAPNRIGAKTLCRVRWRMFLVKNMIDVSKKTSSIMSFIMKVHNYHLVSLKSILQVIPFFSGIGVAIISMYLPLYSYILGASEFVVGIISAVPNITYMFTSFFAGRLSDKLGYRNTFLIGSAIVSLTYIFYAFVPQPILFVPVRALEGIGLSFIWPSLEALAGVDLRNLRTYNLMWGLSLVVAPAIGGTLSQSMKLNIVFVVSSSMMMFCLSLGTLIPKRSQKIFANGEREGDGEKVFTPFLLLCSLFYACTNSIIFTFLPIYSTLKENSISTAGYILTAMNFGRVLAFAIPVNAKKAFGKERALTTLIILSSLLPTFIFFGFWMQLISLFLLGFILGIIYSKTLSNIMIMAGEKRGYYAGLFEFTMGIGSTFGPFFGGIIASLSLYYVFYLPLIICFALVIISVLGQKV